MTEKRHGAIPRRDFVDVLTELDYGSVHKQLTEELETLVKAVRETGKAGKLTLTIDVKTEDKSMMIVRGAVKTTLPKPGTMPSTFYSTEDGVVTQTDPRQLKMSFAEAKRNNTALANSLLEDAAAAGISEVRVKIGEKTVTRIVTPPVDKKVQRAVQTLRNPVEGAELVSHGFQHGEPAPAPLPEIDVTAAAQPSNEEPVPGFDDED